MSNDRENRPEQGDDDFHEGEWPAWLAEMRRVEPPLSARTANRTTVAAELAQLRTTDLVRDMPWWRRRVAVPVPVLAALCGVVITAAALGLGVGARSNVVPVRDESTLVETRQPAVAPAESMPRRETSRQVAAMPQFDYYETRTYLCGVGFITTESGYEFQEPSP